jgi:nucleotidyltransferase/DNA polymerase involved in DNA repair
MDAFFASVEQLTHPEWRGKPVIVGADPKKGKGRGVVAAASYEAREYGIHSAMPISKAYKLCPHGIYTQGHRELYSATSRKIFDALLEFTPVIEPVSIDEAFMDMTGSKHFFSSLEEIGQKIKQRVKEVSGLTCSVGIAPNKSIAKIASDLNKPDGLVVIREEKVRDFLGNLDIRKIWGIGARTAESLGKWGIQTCKDLWEYPKEVLISKFGKFGEHLYQISRGIDDRPVETRETIKSVSNEHTFHEDVKDLVELKRTLLYLSEKVAFRLKKYGFSAKTIVLKLRYEDFETHTKNLTLINPILHSNDIYHYGCQLLKQFPLRKKVRLIGIGVSGLVTEEEGIQQSIFDMIEKKDEKIDHALKSIRDRFGEKSIVRAETLKIKRKHEK